MVDAADFDARVRTAVFALLDRETRHNKVTVPAGLLRNGVTVEGTQIQIANFTRGIFKPAALESALSIFTAPPRAGRAPAYDDHMGSRRSSGTTTRATRTTQTTGRSVERSSFSSRSSTSTASIVGSTCPTIRRTSSTMTVARRSST